MKKQLLIVLSVLPAYIFAQNYTPVIDPKIDIPQPILTNFVGTDAYTGPFKAGKSNTTNNSKLNKHIRYSGIKIGKTFYDLQTNASVGRRVFLNADGTISAVWTTAPASSADFPDRGSGYNHKSTSWMPTVNTRLDVDRAGWPCLGTLEDGTSKYELVMGHIAATGGWLVSRNTGIGSSSWSKLNLSLDQLDGKVALWGRIGTNNKQTVHLISNYNGSTTGTPPIIKINGVSNPTTYSRSLDGAKTWDKKFMPLPGYDSSRTLFGSADSYAIDVKDSLVAIVIGGLGEDIALYKSTNGGDSFTRIMVEEFPFSPWDVTKNKFDVPATNRAKTSDGTFDVLIDNNNKVHVFFSRSFVFDDDTTVDGTFFSPGTNALMHWAEGFDSAVLVGGALDYNNNGQLDITGETTTALDGNGNNPNPNLIAATRYGSSSLVSFPSSSVDANNNLYCVFSAVREDDSSDVSNGNFHDIYVSFSTDDGATWNNSQNLTASVHTENMFASVAKRADNFLHVIYQEDELPGTNLQNNGNTGAHANIENSIIYKAIPVADILGGLVRDAVSVKKVVTDPKIFFVSQNQPNPFNSETQTYIYMRDGSDLNLTVSDITGKVLRTENLGYHSAGNHPVTINADGLSAGIYLYTLANNQYSITKKMQVK